MSLIPTPLPPSLQLTLGPTHTSHLRYSKSNFSRFAIFLSTAPFHARFHKLRRLVTPTPILILSPIKQYDTQPTSSNALDSPRIITLSCRCFII